MMRCIIRPNRRKESIPEKWITLRINDCTLHFQEECQYERNRYNNNIIKSKEKLI
ncbi:unnamed protein product [Paramecium sonneborni]|uniref:Uncharacterized protein n=1 Tax=Paramecium sonneborni TaxID=65129 RepID=A0A8S1R3I5_9CILI|nr:unnamed protein product [Paramecium sonneborni]